ncbi:NACHT domain-containing protein [Streptomyces griseoluteus]|uniref:NACHT domain-containing protein n=1 Tax=Streptomyces griseoluteus TaxID=29306 RepID=UPI0037FF640F
MVGDVFGIHVPRVCRIRGAHAAAEDSIPRVAEAFRTGDDDVATHAGQLREGALALPSVVAGAGAMIVLGEPGAGKTSVLKHLTDMLPRVVDRWDPSVDACLWVAGGDLTEISYQGELGCYLESLPSAETGATADAGTLWVVLDQADESSLRQKLTGRLKRSLRGRDTSRVRFLMACRTADYPQTLTPVLSEAFGACWSVDLVPLSRDEAVSLADSADVRGEDLVTAAEEAGAAVLAGVPLTLELLVLTYRADSRLHGTPESLFARGVARLAEDHDPYREGKPVTSTAPQRLMVAGRIAAWMLLSGHRTVWRGRAFEAGAYDLEGGALADGQERTVAGAFDVTRQVVEETLETALFTAPDQNRVEFRHSSVAAYLAARYLTDRGTTQQQLENLFLVGAPDGETASIPAPLRETAAWLVAMNPTVTAWLAAADPESLAVHSSLVRSDEVRRLTVSRLLERAAQVELSDIRWQLSRWDLGHPMLADQLADALETAPCEGAADWQTRARVRLAIQLAQDADVAHPRLADELLRLLENGAWHQTERRLAARAAFSCGDTDRTVPVLTKVLASLAEPPYAAQVDPDHELRGTLLELLWPDHLNVTLVLAALRPPSPSMYGNYAQFLRNMPTRCADEDLTEVLVWVQQAVLQQGTSGNGFVFSPDRLETPLIDAVIDRTLRSKDATQYLGSLAKIIHALFREYHKVRFPDCLQPDEQGQESSSVRSLRRLLTQALVGEAVSAEVDPREAAYLIVYDWDRRSPLRLGRASTPPDSAIRYQLVDGSDFSWALIRLAEASASGNEALVAAYGEMASCLFPRDDYDAFELAYDEQHPAWPYMRPFYEPIELDSRLAQTLRRNYQASNGSWPEAAEFLSEQGRLLAEAREGNNDSLWQFLWRLRVNPKTGKVEDAIGSISTWVGADSLGDDLSDLPELAVKYLTTENDRADSWLQNSKRNRRSWAGYALLVELYDRNQLAELPSSSWRSWTASILTEILGSSASFMEPARRDLLRLASMHAAESVAQRFTQIAAAALSNAQQPIELNAVDPRWATELRTAMEYLARELSTCLGATLGKAGVAEPAVPKVEGALLTLPESEDARDAALRTWYSILSSLVSAESSIGYDLIDVALGAYAKGPVAERMAVLAAQVLLTADAEAHWPRVKVLVATDAEFGRRLAEGCARNETERIQSSLDDAGVADLYLWLSGLYAPEEDQKLLEAHWVSADEQAREWRDRLLRELSQRASAEAVRQLRQLASLYPERLAVAAALVSAVKQYAAGNWSEVRPEDVMRVLQDPSRRVIRTSADLIDVVYDSLVEVGRDIPSHGELLWDRTPGVRSRKKSAPATGDAEVPEVWRPKPEAALCAYLAHELNLRLTGHRVAVNREVLVHPTDPYGAGDRTDILIEAYSSPAGEYGAASGESVKLVIEVKGAWNDGVLTDQDEQLAGRYLPEVRTDAGIFLVGWYPIDLWDAPRDRRKTQAKKLDPESLLVDLRDQAERLSRSSSVRLRPIVITVPRPHKQGAVVGLAVPEH